MIYFNYLITVSHSLGGATAVLCALDLYQQGVKNIKLFTQGNIIKKYHILLLDFMKQTLFITIILFFLNE